MYRIATTVKTATGCPLADFLSLPGIDSPPPSCYALFRCPVPRGRPPNLPVPGSCERGESATGVFPRRRLRQPWRAV